MITTNNNSSSSDALQLSNVLNCWQIYLTIILFSPIFFYYSFVNNADLIWQQLSFMDNLPFTNEEKLATATSFSQKGTFFLMIKIGLKPYLLSVLQTICLIGLTIGYGKLLEVSLTTKKLISVSLLLTIPVSLFNLMSAVSLAFTSEKVQRHVESFSQISISKWFPSINYDISLAIGSVLCIVLLSLIERKNYISLWLLAFLPVATILAIKLLIL